MIEELKDIIKDEKFKVYLNNHQIWESKDVDYHPPRVERVWMPIDNMRLSLHIIHPCEKGEALVHPHPWQSAIHVLPIGGFYEHGIGYNTCDEFGNGGHEIVSKQIVEGAMYYEMLNKNGVHYVRPLIQPVMTIMLTKKPIWQEKTCKVDKNLVSLSTERKKEILLTFKNYFE